VTLWSTAAPVFTGPKEVFLSIQLLISCNLHSGKFWNFSHIFSNQYTTKSYGYMYPKMLSKKQFVLVLEMAVLESFWWKHSQKPLGVNYNGMIKSFPRRNKSTKPNLNFGLWKKWFFLSTRIARVVKKTTYHTITFKLCSQKLWKLLQLEDIPCLHVVWKFQRKTKQNPHL